jgi:glycosyltransferase involved in cell wall biosynthesis
MKFGIDAQTVVLSFRAVKSEFKGLNHIKDSLRQLNTEKKICLLTFNETGLMEEFSEQFQIIDLGWVDDEVLLAEAYSASDIFLMPSTAEAFGVMAIEAMACGKPVIVFEKTSLSEVTFSPQGGVAVPHGDSRALTHALERLVNEPAERERLGKRAEFLAAQHYSFEVHANKVLQVYKDVIREEL